MMTISIICVQCDHHHDDDHHHLCTMRSSSLLVYDAIIIMMTIAVCDASLCDASVHNVSVHYAKVRGSHRTKSSRPEGPKGDPKGLRLEVLVLAPHICHFFSTDTIFG